MTRLTAFVILAGLVVPTASAVAKTIQVPKDHATIQAAVDGDKILVKGETHDGFRIERRHDLRILGKGKPVITTRGIEIIESMRIEISGLTVQTMAGHGVVIDESSEVTIRKCTIRDVGGDGIRAMRSGTLRIEKNGIEDISDVGINLHWEAGQQTMCVGVVVQKNVVSNIEDQGIVVFGLGHEIVKNRVTDTGSHSFWAREMSGDSAVTGNRFENTNDEGMLVEGDNFTITKNSVTDTAGDGISIEGDRNTLEKNKYKTSNL